MSGEHMNQQPSILALERFEGIGRLCCQHKASWDCTFTIVRLLNGRLRVDIVLDMDHDFSGRLSNRLRQHELFAVEGTSVAGNHISASNIHFTRTTSSPLHCQETLIGYAPIAARSSQTIIPDSFQVECEISNFLPTHKVSDLVIQGDGLDVRIQRLRWKEQGEIEEHGNAYRHSIVSTSLVVPRVATDEYDGAVKRLRAIVELLSFAGRGYVFVTAQHRYSLEGQWLDSQFNEPPFTSRGWIRPLIPDDALGDFLQVAYPRLVAKYQRLELANAIDHYLQAMTLRSVWPSSLGIFTAMETLRAAYFYQSEEPEDREAEFWVVPPRIFDSDPEVFGELVKSLSNHFPRFRDLTVHESQSLKAQLRNINRRSYKTQLRRMLDQLKVDYQRRELQPFVSIRNRIVHYGTPARSDVPTADYEASTSKASDEINDAVSLFERTLLAILGYTGPKELFNAEEGRIHNG